jgi:predicted O-linked N-acetylglucosamine transferase (SPINDLY family)
MGVPIVALEGDSELSKCTSGMLRGAGADALVGRSADEYRAIAIRLAGDRQALAAWRSSLRQRVAASPMFSTGEVTGSLEEAYRSMWLAWVEGRLLA